MKKQFLIFILFLAYSGLKAQQYHDPSYFPIAVWWQTTSVASQYRDAGINMYVTGEQLTETTLGVLKAADMKVICCQYPYPLSQVNEKAIYGWIHYKDEPDNSNVDYYGDCTPISVVINNYKTMKAADPTRPVYLNLGMGVSYLSWAGRGSCANQWWQYADTITGHGTIRNGYIKASDIISYDIYPVNSKYALVSGNLSYVSKGVDSLKSWSKTIDRPTWTCIETTLYNSGSILKRTPTPTEVKAEVWMAIIHGATGITYFAHKTYPVFIETALLQDPYMLAAVKEINFQITSIAPVINSPTLKTFATKSSSNASVPVDIMSKYYNGSNYIFAVPMLTGSTTVTFSTTNTVATSVEVIGENRSIPIVNGVFSDDFSDYQVHLYKMNLDTGVETYQMINPKIYPNPLRTSATIDLTTQNNFPYELSVTDLQGRLLQRATINSSKYILNRNELNEGMYLYSLRDNKNRLVANQKFTIE